LLQFPFKYRSIWLKKYSHTVAPITPCTTGDSSDQKVTAMYNPAVSMITEDNTFRARIVLSIIPTFPYHYTISHSQFFPCEIALLVRSHTTATKNVPKKHDESHSSHSLLYINGIAVENGNEALNSLQETQKMRYERSSLEFGELILCKRAD
jgi:hypothetical protein